MGPRRDSSHGRALTPREVHDKWGAITRATGTSNILQDALVEARLRAIYFRSGPAALGGRPGTALGELYHSWERCSRFCSEEDAARHRARCEEARHELRHDASVVAALARFWGAVETTFPDVMQNAAVPSKAAIYYAQYEAVQLLLHRVLAGRDEAAASAMARHDWEIDRSADEADVKGRPVMRKGTFLDAIFAVVDTWARGTTPSEYAAFLGTVFEEITDEFDTKLW